MKVSQVRGSFLSSWLSRRHREIQAKVRSTTKLGAPLGNHGLGAAPALPACSGSVPRPLEQHVSPIGPVAPDEPQPMEPASPELEPAQQRRQPLLVSLAAVTTTARSKPMLSTSTWRLRPLTRLPPSKPPAQWVRQPSGTDCVSAMATQGDWGRLRSSRTHPRR